VTALRFRVPAVVLDIEGTIASISFVKDVLFPYARARLRDFIAAHRNDEAVAAILDEVRRLEGNDGLTETEIAALLERWIDEDRKATPLKTLQGLIWRGGYESGELCSHLYDDAVVALKRWHDAGIGLSIYSSGSIAAQHLYFRHSIAGDLLGLFDHHFDTTTGPKTQAASYTAIAQTIGQPPASLLYLSDHAGEITAARDAGFQVVRIDRALPVEAVGEDPDGTPVAGSLATVTVTP
jgi:enolase-phosphatase E1